MADQKRGLLTSGTGPGDRLIRTATETATDLIRRAILSGRLKPGQRLREVELAAELGISRTPIREALLILQAEGSIDAVPNRGASVRAVTLDEVIDFVDVRSVLQIHAAYRAATRITVEQLATLDAICERSRRLVDSDDALAVADEHLAFHDVVIAAAESPALTRIVETITRLPLVYQLHVVPAPGARERSLRQQQEIAEALRARDPDRASEAMRALTASVLAALRAHQSGGGD